MPSPLTPPCPACGSPRTRAAFRREGDRFVRCRDCKSLFDQQPAAPDEMARIYAGKNYYVKDEHESAPEAHAHGYTANYLADRPYIEAKFERVLGHIERYVRPGRLLDVGCGPGFLLHVAKQRGWEPIGLDLNSWAVAHAREELGVDARLGALRDDSFMGEQFDAVTLMDLVEHVPSSDELLTNVSRLVRPGGAIAILTPDAGSPVSRTLGRRWPEVIPGEHAVLFSVEGLSTTLRRHGFSASSWHSIGKEAPVATLLADAAPAARAFDLARRKIASHAVGHRVVDVDPHTKFCLYARRLHDVERPPSHRPARVPKQPERLAGVDEAILQELQAMAASERLCRWTFDTFARWVPGATVLEVGAGIGTFTQRMIDADAAAVLAMEPEARCAEQLDKSFVGEPRVEVTREALPDAPLLKSRVETFDLVVCQNVLEHIGDDRAALGAMAAALRPGGRLSLLVPAGPRLFGALDDAYGHWRRYRSEELADLVASTGLRVDEVQHHNALGVAGWWAKNLRPGARVDATSLRAYEALVGAWRPLEERFEPDAGLSLVCSATKR